MNFGKVLRFFLAVVIVAMLAVHEMTRNTPVVTINPIEAEPPKLSPPQNSIPTTVPNR